MMSILLRDATPDDFPSVLALNAAEVEHTSAMDGVRLAKLAALSTIFRVATVDGEVAAFLMVMRDGCGYVNPNFDWFAARHPRFLYIDRIVVGARFQGLGLGSRLYRELFGFARDQGVPVLACEYNVEPPNEPSRIFHDRFGFREVGSQWLDEGRKRVSLQVASTAAM